MITIKDKEYRYSDCKITMNCSLAQINLDNDRKRKCDSTIITEMENRYIAHGETWVVYVLNMLGYAQVIRKEYPSQVVDLDDRLDRKNCVVWVNKLRFNR
jgi:hypothetical protein